MWSADKALRVDRARRRGACGGHVAAPARARTGALPRAAPGTRPARLRRPRAQEPHHRTVISLFNFILLLLDVSAE